MHDIIIVGAGVIGCAIARELSRRHLRVAVLEKKADVGEGASKANSGIVHAGFDAEPGSLKARLNLRGSQMMPALAEELGFSYENNGSLVLCFDEGDRQALEALRERGNKNGVPGLAILEHEQVRALEPMIHDDVCCALHAPSGAIVCPFGLTVAMAEDAAAHGAVFYRNCEVTDIEKNNDCYVIATADGQNFSAQIVINAAGLYSDHIHAMVSAVPLAIAPRRGEYLLFDKKVGNLISHTLFQLPTAYGKGVLITPTIHGNLMIGPNAEDIGDKEGVNTTAAGLETVLTKAARSVGQIPVGEVIASFAGLRAFSGQGDFIIAEAGDAPGFIDIAGIDSPGLSSAPAIAEYVAALVDKVIGDSIRAIPRHGVAEEKPLAPAHDDPAGDEIICRCESVSRAEIIAAIRRCDRLFANRGVVSLDSIKRRVRAGSGRCQGGFCSPRIVELIAAELGVDKCAVPKAEPGSEILVETLWHRECESMRRSPVRSTGCITPEAHLSGVFSTEMNVDLAIIGGGPAGLAAALAAHDKGIKNIVIVEREKELGGILNQCIHHGFGLQTFKEELTGPEYAARYVAMTAERDIPFLTLTMVVNIDKEEGAYPYRLTVRQGQSASSSQPRTAAIRSRAIILAMGCRERPRGALNIPGYRPAGIFNAGSAQRFVNLDGFMPGKKVVVLGSGDIGLIMARRMKLQGADVKMVVEIMPYSGGLVRNVVQCLEDYGIPLRMNHTIIDIAGKDRLCGVTVAAVDEHMAPLPDTAEYVPCDTLLVSCGLIPENELTRAIGIPIDDVTGGPVVNARYETPARGIFACGNVLHVHDLVDNVSREAAAVGHAAAAYLGQSGATSVPPADLPDWGEALRPKAAPKSRYTPATARDYENQIVCIGCPRSCLITRQSKEPPLIFSGHGCPVGEAYAREELTAPTRFLASLVRVEGGRRPVVSVKTASAVPKEKIFAVMEEIRHAVVPAPVAIGATLISNVATTGIDVIATAAAPLE